LFVSFLKTSAKIMNKKNSLLSSIIVPCFNEQDVIRKTHLSILEPLDDNPGFVLKIIYVNDGSSDQTEEILFDMAAYDKRVKP
jgi:glycosyltransferase involved in cell wall biosynthesis